MIGVLAPNPSEEERDAQNQSGSFPVVPHGAGDGDLGVPGQGRLVGAGVHGDPRHLRCVDRRVPRP